MTQTVKYARLDDFKKLETTVEAQATEIKELKETVEKLIKKNLIDKILELSSLSKKINKSIDLDNLDSLSIGDLESKLSEVNEFIKVNKIGISITR